MCHNFEANNRQGLTSLGIVRYHDVVRYCLRRLTVQLGRRKQLRSVFLT